MCKTPIATRRNIESNQSITDTPAVLLQANKQTLLQPQPLPLLTNHWNKSGNRGTCSNAAVHANSKAIIDFSRFAATFSFCTPPLDNDMHSLGQRGLKDPRGACRKAGHNARRFYVRRGNYDIITAVIMSVNCVGIAAAANTRARQLPLALYGS